MQAVKMGRKKGGKDNPVSPQVSTRASEATTQFDGTPNKSFKGDFQGVTPVTPPCLDDKNSQKYYTLKC